jgi:hypothetical protein
MGWLAVIERSNQFIPGLIIPYYSLFSTSINKFSFLQFPPYSEFYLVHIGAPECAAVLSYTHAGIMDTRRL